MNICLVEAPILNTNSLQTGQGFLDVPVSQFRHVSSLSTRSPPRPPWYVLTSHNEAKCSVMHHAWTCFVPGPPFLGRRCWPATSRFVDNTGCFARMNDACRHYVPDALQKPDVWMNIASHHSFIFMYIALSKPSKPFTQTWLKPNISKRSDGHSTTA